MSTLWSHLNLSFWRVPDPRGASQGRPAPRDNANLFLGHF